MNQTRQAKERDALIHLLRQAHRTEIRQVTEKVAMTEVQKTLQNLLVQDLRDKRTDYFVQTSRMEVVHEVMFVIIGMFPNVQNSKLQVDADSETCVHTETQQNLRVKKTASIAIHIPLNNER